MAGWYHEDLNDSRFKEKNVTNYIFKGNYLTEDEYKIALLQELQLLGAFSEPWRNVSDVKQNESDALPTSLKFDEDKYLEEFRSYIANTYKEHYSKGNVQTFELLVSAGQADGFTMGSIMKYAARYGKKEGYNRKDILKILHYALLQLYVHDREGRS